MNQRDREPGELFVVLDGFGDWTPFAVFRDGSEAIKLRDMLAADADVAVSAVPYYESKQAVDNDEPSAPPAGLDEVTVAWSGDEALAAGEEWGVREIQCERGGLRTTKRIRASAEQVAKDRPSAVGQFIDSELSSDDLLNTIR